MLEDLDPAGTREWLEALDSVLAYEGADRAWRRAAGPGAVTPPARDRPLDR